MSAPARKTFTRYSMRLEDLCTPTTVTLDRKVEWLRNEETNCLELEKSTATLHVATPSINADPAIMMGAETRYDFDGICWQMDSIQKDGEVFNIWFRERFPRSGDNDGD